MTGRKLKRATIRDVSMHAGASIASVSRVVSGKGSVSPTLQARICKSVAALGYTPHAGAQALGRGASNTILIVSFVESDALGGPILHALTKESIKKDHETVVRAEIPQLQNTVQYISYISSKYNSGGEIFIIEKKYIPRDVDLSLVIPLITMIQEHVSAVAEQAVRYVVSSPSCQATISIECTDQGYGEQNCARDALE